MKILLVAERYYPEVGAAPTRLANMAEGLHKEGHDVDVLAALPNYPEGKIYKGYRHRLWKRSEVNGVNTFRYWIYATVSRGALARALNMLSFAFTMWFFALRIRRCRKYDCVIIQTPQLFVAHSAMWIFKGLYRRKCVLNVSDIWPSTAVDMGAMKEGSKSYKAMAHSERYLYRRADGILGQSNEILDRVKELPNKGKLFLYRNLPTHVVDKEYRNKGGQLKIVFAGMLGVAQDILGIVEHVPFKELGVEFHILGGGNQFEAIKAYIDQHPDCNVFAHGFIPKTEIAEWYEKFDASIVPLMTRIRGAFPSKVFDILPMGLPILFCGGGEGADFVTSHEVGYASSPADYEALTHNIRLLKDLSDDDYRTMSANCIKTTKEELNFDKQMKECITFLENA